MGFVFCFNNILEKKLNDGKMQVNEGSKECITYFEIEKYEGKKIMFLFFYDGIISIYTQEKEIYVYLFIILIVFFNIFKNRLNGIYFIQNRLQIRT